MMFNWNNNDTKYIIKKIIIGLCMLLAITILTTWKAHALELGKPTEVKGFLLNDPNDYNGNGIWLVNYGSNITNKVFINYDPNNMTTFWEAFTYNNNLKLKTLAIVWDFPQTINTNAIITFRFAYTTNNVSDSFATLVKDIRVRYEDDTDSQCGVVQTGYDTNRGAINYEIKCITQPHTPKDVRIYFEPLTTDYTYEKYYISEYVDYNLTPTEQEIAQTQEDIKNGVQYLIDLSENSVTTNADDNFLDNFFSNSVFNDTEGLQSIITLPLHMVSNLSNTCQPINLTLPFINANITLPCMSTIYQTHFNGIYTLISVVINGFFVYRILLKIYQLVHDAKDPVKDKLEVVEL